MLQVYGYRRFDKNTHQVLDTVELSLPDITAESDAVWVNVSEAVFAAARSHGLGEGELAGGVHAIAHALISLVPTRLMCSGVDLATECLSEHAQRLGPLRVMLLDAVNAGSGLIPQCISELPSLWTTARTLISECSCDQGCLACIHCSRCREYNAISDKNAALWLLTNIKL